MKKKESKIKHGGKKGKQKKRKNEEKKEKHRKQSEEKEIKQKRREKQGTKNGKNNNIKNKRGKTGKGRTSPSFETRSTQSHVMRNCIKKRTCVSRLFLVSLELGPAVNICRCVVVMCTQL